jgi:hypothetical protein
MQVLSAGRLAPGSDCSRSTPLSKCLSIALAFVSLSAGQAWAIAGGPIRPFIDLGMGYDSNLFHFAGDSEAMAGLGEPVRSVTYQRFGAGADFAWKPGRQQLNARLGVNQTSFNRYAERLDYNGKDFGGEWKWQLGNRWSGLLSSSLKRTQSTPTISGIADSNVADTRRQAFMAEYWLHTNWRARLRIDETEQEYTALSQSISDSQSNSTTLGVSYQGGAFENLGVEWVDTRSEFPNRPLTSTLDKRSDKQALRLSGKWAISGKTSLSGTLGYAHSTHPNLAHHDYSGLEGRLTGRWMFTGKSMLETTFSHQMRESGSLIANHEVVDSLNLASVWQVQPKTRLIARASVDHIDYEGDVRKDRQRSLGLAASYEIWRGGDLSINLQHTRRSSSDAAQEYASNVLFVSTNLYF